MVHPVINNICIWAFTQAAHDGQTRSDGTPYAFHPLEVAKIVKEHKVSKMIDTLVIAAYLHDTIEDTGLTSKIIEALFGRMIASLVEELTSDKDEIARIGKTAYLTNKMIHMTSYALVIKLADRLHNVSDLKTAKSISWREKYKAETIQIIDALEANRVLSSTHKKLIELIRKVIAE